MFPSLVFSFYCLFRELDGIFSPVSFVRWCLTFFFIAFISDRRWSCRAAQLMHANHRCPSTCRCLGSSVQGVKGEVRDRPTVEGLIPSAKEGRNVSYEVLSPADIFTLSFCFLRQVTVSLCKPRIHQTILIFEFKTRKQRHQLFYNKLSNANTESFRQAETANQAIYDYFLPIIRFYVAWLFQSSCSRWLFKCFLMFSWVNQGTIIWLWACGWIANLDPDDTPKGCTVVAQQVAYANDVALTGDS